MAAESGKMLAVGLRHVQLFELNDDGYPNATSTSAYEGNQMVGAKAFDVSVPGANLISHKGDDRVLQVDLLPPGEQVSATLRTSRNDFDVYAILTGTTEVTLGEAKMIGVGTDQQGFEPQVGLMCYQQALDDSGERCWRAFLFPRARIFPQPGGMSETPPEHSFTVAPQVVSKHLWGLAFASGTEGFTTAQMLELHCEGKPKIAAFKTDGVETEYSLPVNAKSTDKIKVYKDGVDITSSLGAIAVDKVTLSAAGSGGELVVVFYETD